MSDLQERIENIEKEFLERISSCENSSDLENIRIHYLSRNGILNSEILKNLSQLSKDDRPVIGGLANKLKKKLELLLKEKKDAFSSEIGSSKVDLDLTLPGRRSFIGKLHPLTLTMNRIKEIFVDMGFSIAEGPDIETEYYNFDSLNFPQNHPAKDMHDTFYLEDGKLLRTHTSPVQIRLMEKKKPPLRYIMPGKVYRCDSDVSHSLMFNQVEGLVIGENVNFSHLKYVLHEFARAIFHKDAEVRFRPSYFPFTEPSAEVDITCVICKGKGCRVCKNTGWIEILGAGMVDPNVFKSVGIDPEKYTGYAFGMGVERIAMLVYSIDDIRLFFENNLEFTKQFS
ncbi:MAG: phenylalanine--tRNA ligase subunit alpha [Candidatus Aureabacteria bacterium]|nr:phenylalanine--tRNA ligase subunit alpha [Candidatus Auribacterota bacterium]